MFSFGMKKKQHAVANGQVMMDASELCVYVYTTHAQNVWLDRFKSTENEQPAFGFIFCHKGTRVLVKMC